MLKGKTGTGQTKYVHSSHCLNVSSNTQRVMCEGKSFHIGLHFMHQLQDTR